MSKTLFNTNTFQSKNVRNSDDVGTLKVDTFKAVNAILTNITNAELQAATAGVANNASAISTNTTNISNNTTAISNNTTAISANATNISNNTTAISTNATNISNNTTAISTNATNISNNTTAISGKQDALSAGEGIDITGTDISFDGTLTQDVSTSGTITGATMNYLDSGVVTNIQTKIDTNTSAISGKQDTLTDGNGIDITGTTISFDGTSVTGDITTTGTITGATMNYVNSGVVTNIQTEIESKQDILTQADNAGTNITISATGVISASGGGTYTAEANGGLAVNASNEFSLDFSNTNSTIEIPQSSYIEQGLILDPYDMGTTTFTNGVNDSQASATSREDIYIKFAPNSTVANDWVYLRNIGENNKGQLALDYHDDNDDVRFSIRNVRSSGVATDIITEIFDVLSSGVTAHTAVYRIPQQVFINFNIASMTGSNSSQGQSRFGDGGRFNSIASTRTTGSSFTSHSNGTFTFSADGYYKIRVAANNQNITYDDRTAFAVYLNINGTEYFQNRNYNFFGWGYTRNTTDGAHGNIVFEDCIYIANTQTLQVKTKMDSNNRSWDDSLSLTQMNCYCNLQIERIAETDIS